jgi:hypothetical protein
MVTADCVKGSVNGKVRVLSKPDFEPEVIIPSNGSKTSLVVIRNGNAETLPISRRVAEELIAAGFAYGD